MNYFSRAILLSLFAALLTACGSHDNTPKPAKLVSFKRTLGISRQWETSIGHGSAKNYLHLAPRVEHGIIYTPSADGEISANDITTGQERWTINSKLAISTGTAVHHGLVFVGTTDAQVAAFDALNGKQVWQTTVPSEVLATPTPAGNALLVKTIDGHLLALSEQTGKKIWSYLQDVPSLILRGSSPATHTQTLAIAGFANGKLAALTKDTGSETWVQTIAIPKGDNPVENMVDIDAMPLVKSGIVYVVTYQGNIAALSAQSGTVLWQHTFSSYSGLALDDTHVYASDANGSVWAFDQNSGRVLWVQKALAHRILTGPAIMDDHTIAVADREGYIHWLSIEDGHFVARMRATSNGILATPLVVNHVLFVVSTDGDLSAYAKRS